MTPHRRIVTYHLFAAATALIWSFSYVHIVWLAEEASALQAVIARNYFAVPVIAFLWLWRRPRIQGLSVRQWSLIIAIGLASGPCYHLPLHWGGSDGRTDASLLGLIVATIPIHVGWLAWITLGERLTLKRALGLLFGMAGVLVVVGGHQGFHFEADNIAGPLAVVTATIVAAFNVVLTRSARKHFNPLDLACVSITVALILYLLVTPFASMDVVADFSMRSMWSACYLGVFAIGIALVCWISALSGGLPAVSVALYLFLTCLFSALWAWMWQDNAIGVSFFAGAGLVLAGLIIGAQPSRNDARVQPPQTEEALPAEGPP